MKMNTLLAGAGIALFTGALSAEQFTLKPKLNTGDRHQLEISGNVVGKVKIIRNEHDIENGQTLTLTQEVSESESGKKLDFSVERVQVVMGIMGRAVEYDSNLKKKQSLKVANQIHPQLAPLLEKKFSATYEQDGSAVEVEEVVLEQEKSKAAMQRFGLIPHEMVGSFYQQNHMLPKKPVSVADQWDCVVKVPIGNGSMADAKLKVTLAGVEDIDGQKIANLDFSGTFEGNFEHKGMPAIMKCDDYQGKAKFNLTKGMYDSVDIAMKATLKQEGSGDKVYSATSKMTVSKAKPVEEPATK